MGGKPRRFANKGKREYQSPIDRAHGRELVWQQVSPLFTAARVIVEPRFVYFIGEDNDGPMKIGTAKDPIQRLRDMQTGNSRRLRVEWALVGTRQIEKLLHEYWAEFAIKSVRHSGVADTPPGTEWFRAEARDQMFPIIAAAALLQIQHIEALESPEVYIEDLEDLVRQAHADHDFIPRKPHQTRLLGSGGGYYTPHRSRL